MNEWLVMAGTFLAAASGVPGLWTNRHGTRGERTFAALMVVA